MIKFQAIQGSKVDTIMGCAKAWVNISLFKYILLWLGNYSTRILWKNNKICGDKSLYEK